MAREIDMKSIDSNVFLNILLWNLNYWDNISTFAGEVKNPRKIIPKSFLFAVILVVGTYLIPLLSVVGAIEVVRDNWNDGYFAEAAYLLGGASL